MNRLISAALLSIGMATSAYAQSPYPNFSTQFSSAIDISTATTTKVISNVAGKWTYITSFNVIAGGAGNIQLEYGTGTNCATGTVALTGNYNLAAQAGLVVGTGTNPVLVVPVSNDVCIVTSAAVEMSGSIAYAQQ